MSRNAAVLLRQCFVGCIAARSFVHEVFLVAGEASQAALGAQVKGAIAHKGGASDMVTAADLAVQEVLLTALDPAFARAQGVDFAFDIVGEEDIDGNVDDERIAKYGSFIHNAVASPELRRFDALLQKNLTPPTAAAETPLPGGPVDVASAERLAVYIDPIDATVAFIDGCKIAPMTLVGIACNGTPIGGVAGRVFEQTADEEATVSDPTIVLPLSMSLCLEGGPCVLWGQLLSTTLREESTVFDPLRVTYSGTTTSELHKRLLSAVQPYDGRPARGGGNKIMMVAQSAAKYASAFPHPHTTHPEAKAAAPNVDVFVSAAGLKLWDTCAPHAFLRWLGGDIVVARSFTTDAESLRYGLEDLSVIPKGGYLVAYANPGFKHECLRRIRTAMSEETASEGGAQP